MKLYLISYDLKSPGRNYEGVYDVIKSALSWWHYLESTWIIRTNRDVGYWQEKICAAMDKNDSLLVIDVTNMGRDGWLPQKAWDWIRDQNAQINADNNQGTRVQNGGHT